MKTISVAQCSTHTLIFMCVCRCVSIHVNICMAHGCKSLRKLEVDVGSPAAGVTGGCELPDMGAGNSVLVPWEEK